MNNYLKRAHTLYALSIKELNNAKHSGKDELARDAAGKAWIATVDALRGFLLSRGLKVKELPKSERHRHDLLAKYGNPKMWQLYQSIRGEIHQDAYYEGIINYPLLFDAFFSVKKFIHRCENGG
jgi:hypothetical protein